MESLFAKHRLLISRVKMDIIRECINDIAWERPLVGIRGSRGVGKTTLMRQYIRANYGIVPGKALYCVMDSIYFSNHSLLELGEQFHAMGGKHLFLDEVHNYPFWSREIKELNDLYPDLKITFTGSSLIQIINADADLSRRVLSYNMYGLSFREYLLFYHKIELPSYKLSEILSDADSICSLINRQCYPLLHFNQYLRNGYYPFFDGNEVEYYSRIENVVSFIIDQEMVKFCNIDTAYTRKIKALLLFIAGNVPYEVNITKLSSYLELNKSTVLHYLSALNRAELIHLLYSDNKSVTKMQRPDKIHINNPNTLYALSDETKIGTIRECFAVNQLATNHDVEYGKEMGDFLIDGKWRIEIGGHDKSFAQIADIPDSYIFADNMEYPVGKKLPLWLLGFCY